MKRATAAGFVLGLIAGTGIAAGYQVRVEYVHICGRQPLVERVTDRGDR